MLPPNFCNYFSKKLVPILRDNMIAGQSRWTSNNVESMNHVFKQAVNWRPHMLPDLIKKLQTLVDSQLQDCHLALIGRGNFKLRQSHMRFRVPAEKWSEMNEKERQKCCAKSFVLYSKKKIVKSSNGKLSVFTQPSAGKKQNQRKRKRTAKTFTLSSKQLTKDCDNNSNDIL